MQPMKETVATKTEVSVSLQVTSPNIEWLIIGGGRQAHESLSLLLRNGQLLSVTVLAPTLSDELEKFLSGHKKVYVQRKKYDTYDFSDVHFVIAATDDEVLNECIRNEAALHRVLVYTPEAPHLSDFNLLDAVQKLESPKIESRPLWFQRNSEQMWRRLASQLVFAFLLMVVGHIIISYLPLPSVHEIWVGAKPFLFCACRLPRTTGRWYAKHGLWCYLGHLSDLVWC
jgi:hypothetical protein